jgi:ankyrin repeat protein
MRLAIKRLMSWGVVSLATVVCMAAAAPDLRLVDAAKEQDRARVQALLKLRVDVNAPQADGATALHWAAHWGDLHTTDLLIRAGANANAKTDLGVTPLVLACTVGNAAVIERLLAGGADPNLALATGETPLMRAARTGNTSVVKALLFRGIDVNTKEPTRGQTALMWAAGEGHSDVVRAMLEAGADVNARSTSGYTPLLFATWKGDLPTVKALLTGGANINQASSNGVTPLLMSATRGFLPQAEFLLDQGADVNNAEAGYTVLHWATGIWDSELTVPYSGVLSDSADAKLWLSTGGIHEPEKLEFVRKLVGRGADIHAQMTKNPLRVGGGGGSAVSGGVVGNMAGATPFYLAAQSADVALMRFLKDAGADPTMRKKDGKTPLMAATGIGREQGTSFQTEAESLESARLLVEYGNDVNAVDEAGDTALHAAAYWGHNSVVQFLAGDMHANVDPKNKAGFTPFMIATGQGPRKAGANAIHPDTGALLGTFGADTSVTCVWPCLDNVYKDRTRK